MKKRKNNPSESDSLRKLAENKPGLAHSDKQLPISEAGNVKLPHEVQVQPEQQRVTEPLSDQANLINNISDAVISTDLNFIITGWNKAAEQIYGWRPDDVIGLQAYSILGTKYPDGATRDEAERQLHQKGSWAGEVVQKRKDGVSIHISSSVTAVYNDSGEMARVLAINRDITGRKLAEAEIAKTNDRLKLALHASNSGTWDWNIESNTFYWSEEFLQLFGMNPDTQPGFEAWMNALHPDDRGISIKEIQNAIQYGRDLVKDFRIVLPDKDIRWIRVTGKSFYSGDKPVRMTGLCRDVTLQKEAEEAIRESEEKFRAIFENNSSAMLITDEDTTLVMVNEAFCQLVGCKNEEITGTSWTRLLPPAEVERLKEYNLLRLINSKDAPDKYEFKYYRNNNELRDGLMYISLIPGLKKVVGSFLDITERKKTEEALRESEKKFFTIYEKSPYAILLSEIRTGTIIDVNEAFVEISGYRKEEIIGKTSTSLKLFENKKKRADLLHEITKNGFAQNLESTFYTKSGEKLIIQYNIDIVELNQKKILLSTAQDITKRRQAENALRESEANMIAILNTASESIWLFNTDGEVLMGNNIAIKRLGKPAEDIVGFQFKKHIPKELGDTRFKKLQEAASTKLPVKFIDQQTENYFEHTYYPVINSDGSVKRVAAFSRDISQRMKEEQLQNKLNRTFAALARSSQAILQSNDESSYLQEVCNIVREDCGFEMVWIGFAENNELKSVRPVASAGFERAYLESVKISWDDNEFGRGPTSTAIKTGEISRCTNMLTDPKFLPWRDEAIKYGYASSIAFPLKSESKTFGAIAVYSKEPDSFKEDEISLLWEVSNYLTHGIITSRLRKAREMAEQELRRSKDELEVLVDLRTNELMESNKSLYDEIDVRKKQEARLRAAEEKYRNVADFTSNWETWLAPDGKYIYVSPSCEDITGYTRGEFMEDPTLFLRITHPDDRALIENHYKEEIKNVHLQFSVDFRIRTKDEQIVWIAHTCQPVYDSNGKWLGQRGSNHDITDRKIAESVLIESQAQLRALAQKVNEVAEEERMRIAREIHDELGHLLTALKFDLENLTTFTDATAEEFKTETAALTNLVTVLVDTVRKISTELRPAILDHLGLLPAIEWLISQFKAHTKIPCQFHYTESEVQFDKKETNNIFRIMQEVLTNIARHSQATHVEISLALKDDFFEVKVSDNGIGFNIEDYNHLGAIGLMGIRERAISIGATVDFISEPNKGTEITLLLPGKSNSFPTQSR